MTQQPLTVAQMDAILPSLAEFEKDGFRIGEMHPGKAGSFPYFSLSLPVQRFCDALYHNNWIASGFDWTDWQGEAAKYVEQPELIQTADVDTIRKLLITHVRKERFCEGHLAKMFDNGHIVALLRRLKQIREAT